MLSRQATRIVDLEGKVVDLEAKIAYLQEALAQDRKRAPTVPLVADTKPPREPQASSSGSNERPHGALKQRNSPFKASRPRETQRSIPPPTAYGARPYTPALSHTGSADDPFVLDDEDDTITAPLIASGSPAHKPVSQKRKACLSPAPLPDSLSLLPAWPPFKSPRKKVKVWVQVPKTAKRVSEVARMSVALKHSGRAEQSGGSAVAEPDFRERSMSPMSDLTSPPGSPAPVEVSLNAESALSSAEVGSKQRSRSFSRELSYADPPNASSVPAHATVEMVPCSDQVGRRDDTEERPPPSRTQASSPPAAPGSYLNFKPIDVPDLPSAGSSSSTPAQAKQSRRQALHKAKNKWARAICTQPKFIDIWARVTLRDRLGRVPTSQELQSEIEDRAAQIKAAKRTRGPKSAEEKQESRNKRSQEMDQIIKAYENGDEVMDVWNMVCVGFDKHVLDTIWDEKAAKES
ncbi:hypothetical protein TRAPUB_9673 [Trametes pubescens]|uniref:DUF6697 domain-containing protein n=1 Tax=Trametes pubescens TaxID=154538 RepID=A0A1M2W1Q4_TRAPU|nr:hypothetical protein TRAPUB_9673 [Trametes pubescens]